MEERAEYIEGQKEKNMIAQSAHRGASKPAWRMSGPNGDVVTWPSLPRVYDRLKYITNGLDGAEIAQKIGSTRHAVYQQFGRSENLARKSLLSMRRRSAARCRGLWAKPRSSKRSRSL